MEKKASWYFTSKWLYLVIILVAERNGRRTGCWDYLLWIDEGAQDWKSETENALIRCRGFPNQLFLVCFQPTSIIARIHFSSLLSFQFRPIPTFPDANDSRPRPPGINLAGTTYGPPFSLLACVRKISGTKQSNLLPIGQGTDFQSHKADWLLD
jgi:hypothetical protein